MFLASQEELLAEDSPIFAFANQTVRYVWRPTYVYFKILKYLRKASFMGSFATYQSKLYELISKAYQKGNLEDYRFILAYEMDQLQKGDVPLFNLDSSKHHLMGNESIQTFQYNCIENIENRIRLLSAAHKVEQLEYITNWLRIPPLP
jgi:lantibiotic modifying enzyme